VLATITIEALVICAILIAPIVAAPILPMPPTVLSYVAAAPAPPPPPPPRVVPPARVAPVSTDAAPTTEPDAIQPETPVDPHFDNADVSSGDGVIGGVTDGVPDAPPPPPPQPPPPPAPTPQVPVRVGGEIRPPIKTTHVNPVYPSIARSAGVQGLVILEAVISVTGQVQEVRVLRSHPLLDQAALDAVRQWEFTPTLLNSRPVPVIMTITIQFTLS
jgi:protein TonB